MRQAWYVAQDASRLFAAEAVMGKVLDYRAVIQPGDWAGYTNVPGWLFYRSTGNAYLAPLIEGTEAGRRKIWWSVAPFPTGGTWAAAAAGSYDGYWRPMLESIVRVETSNKNLTGPIEFRFAFEFNGSWFPWKAAGQEANFRAAWQRIWNMANGPGGVAPGRLHFEYAPSETTQLQGTYADPNLCWPGDGFVAKCGLDVYWKPFSQEAEGWTQWGKDANTAFNSALNSPLGLNWLKNFAAAHGNKPMVISEWGVQPARLTGQAETVNTEPYIRQFGLWCRTNNVSNLYWNGLNNEAYAGDVIANTAWPVQRAAIKANLVDYADNSNPFGDSGGGNTGGGTGGDGGWISIREPDPYASALQINSLTYNVTALTAAQIAQINDLSYWPLVASGRKIDAAYTGPALALGDVTAVQASLDTANAQIGTLQASLADSASQNAELRAQATSLTTQLTAARTERDQAVAARNTAQTALTTAQTDRDTALARVAALEAQLGEAGTGDAVQFLQAIIGASNILSDAIPAENLRETRVGMRLEAMRAKAVAMLDDITAADVENRGNA